jgi:cytoskeletal protein CcmA (bactofilin family)
VFKRRKPDEPPANESQLSAPTGGQAAAQLAGISVRGDAGAAPRPADSGLGVPPFRPAPPKEAPAMSRPPFSPQPSSSPTGAPLPPSAGSRPGAGPGRPPVREPAEPRTLVVGRGISVQGTVQDAERLVVEGTVEANLIHATELSIAPGGVFKGEVEVEDAEVAGTVDGTLTARGSLIVRATGRLLGTARSRRLQVEDGGQINCKIEMITEPVRAPGAPAPAPANQD